MKNKKLKLVYHFLYVIKLYEIKLSSKFTMETTYTEVDKLLKTIREQYEINDFINNGIYPERLYSKPPEYRTIKQSSYMYNDIIYDNSITPQLLDTGVHHFTKQIKSKIHMLECELQLFKLSITLDSCPICMEQIEQNNCVYPRCGHQLCIPCFTSNLLLNTYTSKTCAVCRSEIVV